MVDGHETRGMGWRGAYREIREVRRNAVLLFQVERDQGEPRPLARLDLPVRTGWYDRQVEQRIVAVIILHRVVDEGIPREHHALRSLHIHYAHIDW